MSTLILNIFNILHATFVEISLDLSFYQIFLVKCILPNLLSIV